MTQTNPDVEVNDDEWTDVIASAGLSANTTVRVQNKSDTLCIVHFAPTKPTPDIHSGYILAPYKDIEIAGEPFVWVKGLERSFLNVEAI